MSSVKIFTQNQKQPTFKFTNEETMKTGKLQLKFQIHRAFCNELIPHRKSKKEHILNRHYGGFDTKQVLKFTLKTYLIAKKWIQWKSTALQFFDIRKKVMNQPMMFILIN